MRVQPSVEDMIKLTSQNPFGRFDDGRPQVPADMLERMKLVTTEEAWGTLCHAGYLRQFEGQWIETHPGVITVGRAVTAQFLPHRPDYHALVQETGVAEGRGSAGGQNSWIIESLQLHDVMVVDIFGKIKDGTVVGDNLGTAVRTRTRAGAVIDGGVRDFQGLIQLTDVNFYIRGMDPTGIGDVTLAGLNVPIRIGPTTVLPGDVVLGTPSGVLFIPPHLVEKVLTESEDVRVRDEFGKGRLSEGIWTSGQIDSLWSDEIKADFENWKANRPK